MKKLSSVLLIDDDETTNYINKLVVNRAAITEELLVALNGKEAIELITARCEGTTSGQDLPQLIMLDINMPVIDGFGFLEAFNKLECLQDKSVVVAVLTTSLNPGDIERARQAGVTEFLSKPLTRQMLDKLMETYFS
ncbi:MAG TPA: response regulator [Pontibacter sp.]